MRSLSALVLALVACPAPEGTQPAELPAEPVDVAPPLAVTATSFPAAWLVQRVGGEHVVVDNVLPAGEDAPHWQPSAEVIAAVQQADLIVANGAGFEGWMRSATLPVDKVVYTADGLDLITVEGRTHSHGGVGEHSHAGIDPHTWGDPKLFAAQAEVVREALTHASPAHAAAFSTNLAAVVSELGAMSAAYDAATAPAQGLAMASNHSAYEYVERAHGLSIHAFDVPPEVVPTAEVVAEVAEWAGATERKIMLWEAAPSEEVRAALPEGIEHVVVDPLEQPGPSGGYDYVAQSQANVALFLDLFEVSEADAGE